jgi:hypothetical protein
MFEKSLYYVVLFLVKATSRADRTITAPPQLIEMSLKQPTSKLRLDLKSGGSYSPKNLPA